jgi:protein-tyrosine-phosphatase/predicted ATP-grasp superfamily ATP-dependent carboligase
MTKSVLVLGCDERSGLTVVRSLGRASIAVDVGWITNRSASKSRYVRNMFDIPDPNESSGAWLDMLEDLLTKHKYDLVLPCDDRATIAIQRHKLRLGKHSQIYALADDAFLVTFDKHQTTLLAERCGVRLPRWVLVSSQEEIAAAGEGFTFPVVLKPVSSFSLERDAGRREVQMIRSKRDLAQGLEKMLRDGPVQVQAFFRGKGIGVELLAKDGQALVAFQHERLHEPPAGGASSYRRSVPLDGRLLDAAKALVCSLRYTGVIMAEFLVNPENEDWILVETNGRFWGSLPLAAVSGIDFLLHLFQTLVEGRTDFPQKYKIGVYCRNLRLDLRWFIENLQADRNDPTLKVVPLSHLLAELRNVLWLSDRIDTFARDDPRPFFAEVRDLAGRAIRIVSIRAERLTGISRFRKMLRAKRAVRRIRGATKVTFVCYGNISRSPFAEAYARSIAPEEIKFSSAGTLAKADRRSASEACAAAKGIGIDLEGHRSRSLSLSLVEESDVIVIFDRKNLEYVSREFPQAKSRTIRLGDFLPGVEEEIADPFGRPIEHYERCFQTIANLLSQIWPTRAANRSDMGVPTR